MRLRSEGIVNRTVMNNIFRYKEEGGFGNFLQQNYFSTLNIYKLAHTCSTDSKSSSSSPPHPTVQL